MAKKPLTVKTKLKRLDSPTEAKTESVGVIRDTKYYPRSYRWRDSDLELIGQLLEKINHLSPRKIDATKMLRGAMVLADKVKPEKLLDAVVEAERNSLKY